MKKIVLILLAVVAWVCVTSAAEKLVIEKAVTCQWYFNNELIEGIDENSIELTATGNYTAVYQNAEGQTVKSITFYSATTGERVKLFVIGDSTASKYDSSRYPRTGWAQIFQAYFNTDSIEVVDKALSGRSSKSFYTDGDGWPVVKPALSAGDYLFIQFGHNDAKSDEERHTDPYTTYKEYLKKYIDEARAKGAIPVLLTPIHRNGWNITSISNSHGDYPDAMRQLAQEEDVPLIDLTSKTAKLFESYGEDVVTNEFFMNLPANLYSTYPDGNSDNTHLQERGAFEVAKLVSHSFKELTDYSEIEKLSQSSTEAGFVKVSINEYGLGNVTGDRVISIGHQAVLKAYATSGYVFGSYTSDGKVLSKESSYSFVMTDSLLLVEANFVKGYKVNLSLTPKYKGKVSGAGTFGEGDSVTVSVKPYSGYDFDFWSKEGETVSTDSAYTFIMEAADIELIANLKLEGTTQVSSKEENSIRISYNSETEQVVLISPYLFITICLYDVKGNLLQQLNKVNQHEINIGMEQFAEGVYIVNAQTEKGNCSKKIVKY